MNILVFYGLVFVAIINFSFGVIILSRAPKKKANIIFSLISLLVVIWSVAILGFYLLGDKFFQKRVWIIATHLSAGLISLMFFYFTLYFPFSLRISKKLKFLMGIVSTFVFYFVVFTKLVIGNIYGESYQINSGYLFYSLFLTFCFFLGFIGLILQYRKAEKKIEKAQIKYVFFGSLFASVFATFTDLVLPYLSTYKYTWLGPFFTLILVFFTAIAILKHHLFDIKVVATEIFSTILISLLFVNVVTSSSRIRLFANLVVFVFSVLFSALLIRSVLIETKTREKLKKAYDELKKVDKAKTEFISMASHQLRTPLTSIKGYISMLLEGDYGSLKGEQKKVLKNVFFSNERLIRIVNDLLNVSRIELGRMKLQKEKIDIAETIKTCVEEMSQEAKKKGLSLSYKLPSGKAVILADGLKIRQAIINIIDNAIHYTVKGKVEVGLKKEEKFVTVYIKDTGQGLSAEDKRKIFNEFGRGKAGLNLFVSGSGLGLYIVKKYLSLHKGKVWAESEGKGKGSTFYLKIPIR